MKNLTFALTTALITLGISACHHTDSKQSASEARANAVSGQVTGDGGRRGN